MALQLKNIKIKEQESLSKFCMKALLENIRSQIPDQITNAAEH